MELKPISIEVEVQRHRTDVNIDPVDVLDELDPADIEEYLEDRQPEFHVAINNSWDYTELVNSYYHGDFDLKKFLEELKMTDLVAMLETKNFCRS